MFPPFRKIGLSVCLVLLFGLIVPVWSASAKAKAFGSIPSATFVEPVTKAISGTRQFLLGRLEGLKLKQTPRPSIDAAISVIARTP